MDAELKRRIVRRLDDVIRHYEKRLADLHRCRHHDGTLIYADRAAETYDALVDAKDILRRLTGEKPS